VTGNPKGPRSAPVVIQAARMAFLIPQAPFWTVQKIDPSVVRPFFEKWL
jgi:hypothetical protein